MSAFPDSVHLNRRHFMICAITSPEVTGEPRRTLVDTAVPLDGISLAEAAS
jgi:hypothetical protein